MSYTRNANSLFYHHRRNSLRRGIEFHFTKAQWIEWWQSHLGPNWMEKRGRERGKYVMARKADKGSYHPDNVRCILATVNNSEMSGNGSVRHGSRHFRAKLDAKKVMAIRNAKVARGNANSSRGELAKLAAKYGVSIATIHGIRCGYGWKHI